MKSFSEKILVENTIPLSEQDAPAWLRLGYVKNVLKYFSSPEAESFPNQPVDLEILSEELCIRLKLPLSPTRGSNSWDYITERIRNCDWDQFYDIVEIVGMEINCRDSEVINLWNQIVEQIERDGYVEDNDFEPESAQVRLDEYGFDAYLQKVNQLLNSTNYRYTINGIVYSPTNSDVLQPNNPIFDGMGSEVYAPEDIHPSKPIVVEHLLNKIGKSDLFDESDRVSLRISAEHYCNKEYKDALYVIFPIIEMILNKMLSKAGMQANGLHGLWEKAQWLEKHGCIEPDLLKCIEFLKPSRNQLLHGDRFPDAFSDLICHFSFRYLNRLIDSIPSPKL